MTGALIKDTTQARDMDVHGARADINRFLPGSTSQLLTRENAGRLTEELAQQAKFYRSKMKLTAVAEGAQADQIQLDTSAAEDFGLRPVVSFQRSFEMHQELCGGAGPRQGNAGLQALKDGCLNWISAAADQNDLGNCRTRQRIDGGILQRPSESHIDEYEGRFKSCHLALKVFRQRYSCGGEAGLVENMLQQSEISRVDAKIQDLRLLPIIGMIGNRHRIHNAGIGRPAPASHMAVDTIRRGAGRSCG